MDYLQYKPCKLVKAVIGLEVDVGIMKIAGQTTNTPITKNTNIPYVPNTSTIPESSKKVTN
jgi:hypothetical protein